MKSFATLIVLTAAVLALTAGTAQAQGLTITKKGEAFRVNSKNQHLSKYGNWVIYSGPGKSFARIFVGKGAYIDATKDQVVGDTETWNWTMYREVTIVAPRNSTSQRPVVAGRFLVSASTGFARAETNWQSIGGRWTKYNGAPFRLHFVGTK